MKRGRRKQSIDLSNLAAKVHPVKRQDRFCFSEDGIWVGDGDFRWWKEFDDSGYGWDGFFDIISKAQLKERIHMSRTLGIPVYEKCTYGSGDEHTLYDEVSTVSGREDLLK